MTNNISNEQLKTAIKDYFIAVKDMYNSGSRNIETTYSSPIIELFKAFDCNPIDVSGGRAKKKGENVDIELWRANDDINGIEPFGAIEVKRIGGIDERAKKQVPAEVSHYGNVILTNNCIWEFWRLKDNKIEKYTSIILIDNNDNELKLCDTAKIEIFIQLIKDFILADPNNIKNSTRLAQYMAEYARTIRVTVCGILGNEKQKMYPELFALYSKLKGELLPELDVSAFDQYFSKRYLARYFE